MTCIVGLVNNMNNSVIIGGDSASVSDIDIRIRKDKKVFKNQDFILGCTSSFRMINLLQFSFKPPKVNKSKDIYEYMCTSFVDEIRKCFKEGGYLQKYTDGDDKGGTFLIGYKNRLFHINDDFQVGESIDGLDAVGCGSNYALGSLYTTQNLELIPAQKILRALEAAEYYSGGVVRPFTLLST